METEMDERTPQELGNIMWDAGYQSGRVDGAEKCQEVLEEQAGEAYGARNDDLAKILRSAADRLAPTINDFDGRATVKKEGEKEAAKSLGNCLAFEQFVTLLNYQIVQHEGAGHDTAVLRAVRNWIEELPGKNIGWGVMQEAIDEYEGEKEAARALGNCLTFDQVVLLMNHLVVENEAAGHDTDILKDARDYIEGLKGEGINWVGIEDNVEEFGGDLR